VTTTSTDGSGPTGPEWIETLRRQGLLPAQGDVPPKAHRDVLTVALLSGRRTYVHRALWPDVLAIGTAQDDWQMEWLPEREIELLELLDASGTVRMDVAAEILDAHGGTLGRTIESRLLALGGEARTETGATARTLTSWRHWMKRHPSARVAPDLGGAYARLDAAVKALGTKATLPWWRKPLRKRWR
jgi:hypothetical protein